MPIDPIGIPDTAVRGALIEHATPVGSSGALTTEAAAAHQPTVIVELSQEAQAMLQNGA